MKIKDFFVVYHDSGLMPDNFDGYFGVIVSFNCCTNKEHNTLHIFRYPLDAKKFFVKKFGKFPVYLCFLGEEDILYKI